MKSKNHESESSNQRVAVVLLQWIALGMILLLPSTTIFSPAFRANTIVDVLVLMAWGLASVWALGRLLGDAHKEEEAGE